MDIKMKSNRGRFDLSSMYRISAGWRICLKGPEFPYSPGEIIITDEELQEIIVIFNAKR